MSVKLKNISAKKNYASTTLHEYAENSSVHGVSYIFSPSETIVEKLIWCFVVLASLVLAGWFSQKSFTDWQDNQIITTLKNAAKQVSELDFPAVTICAGGLNMNAVENALIKDFEDWSFGKKLEQIDDIKDLIEIYLKEKYNIDSENNIFDILKAMSSPNAEESSGNDAILQNIIVCDEKTRGKRNVIDGGMMKLIMKHILSNIL